jgi:hypothetical protein
MHDLLASPPDVAPGLGGRAEQEEVVCSLSYLAHLDIGDTRFSLQTVRSRLEAVDVHGDDEEDSGSDDLD